MRPTTTKQSLCEMLMQEISESIWIWHTSRDDFVLYSWIQPVDVEITKNFWLWLNLHPLMEKYLPSLSVDMGQSENTLSSLHARERSRGQGNIIT